MKNSIHQPRFYRGEMDDQTGTAEHGAVLNQDYNRIMVEGPWGETKLHNVRKGVYCITGFYVANFTLVESDSGFILIDTGLNRGCAEELLRRKAEISDKPIVAIIYSHNHYTGGARTIIEAHPDRDIPIYAHPDTHDCTFGLVDPGTLRHAVERAVKQMGMLLPKTGPDASATYGFRIPQFEDPALNQSGYIQATHEVADGEELVIDGVRVQFHHVIADAPDSLNSYFPDYDLIQHNAAIMPVMFPLYTLRGGDYRDARDLIAGINKIREISPEHLIGCHGNPVSGKSEVYELATLHRDAYAYLFQQTLRGINRGLSPDQLVQEVSLPTHLDKHPALFPAYIDSEYIVRGVYQGVIGWWANDTADLHPPAPQELGVVIIEGFGGVEAIIDRAQQALDEKQYNLAAKLVTYVLDAEQENTEAKRLKAAALRKMAQSTRSGIQTRNFMLSQALELEGSLPSMPWPAIPPLVNMPLSTVMNASPAETLKLLENHLEPAVLAGNTVVAAFHFNDSNQRCGFVVRNGSAEFLAEAPDSVDFEISLPGDVWAKIAVGALTLQAAVEAGDAVIDGDKAVANDFISAFKGVLGS